MSKLSRPHYGLEEEILQTIFRLRDKKSSELFKEPVDAKLVPDYYEKIKNPMDLSTVILKLKEGAYHEASQVYADLELIIENCKKFNIQLPIIKKAEQFHECIKTEWNNFEKEIRKKDIPYNRPIEITQDILRRLEAIQEKRRRRKTPLLETMLQTEKKNILPQYSVLPPLPDSLFQDRNEIREELPEELGYRKENYSNLSQEQRTEKLNMVLSHEAVDREFEKTCLRKLNKYRKILLKKIMWIEEKIIQKCLEKKKFRKMLLPEYLSRFIEQGRIAQDLQIRKIQMYVKQVTYWVEDYSSILSHYMKQKFVQTCKQIRKCLLRVLRYKRIPKTTKISLELGEPEQEQVSQIQESRPEEQQLGLAGIGDDETKRYESKMKEFRRMLIKDRSQSTKRDTKFTIKNQNGEFSIVDWNNEAIEKRKTNRTVVSEGIRSLEIRQFDEQKRKKEERKDQLKRDQQFILERRARVRRQFLQEQPSTVSLAIDWDYISEKKLYQDRNTEQEEVKSLENFCILPPLQPTAKSHPQALPKIKP